MTFTTHWFRGRRQYFEEALAHLSGPIRVLEIGAWEGECTCWLAERFQQADIEVIDTFEGNPEHIEKELYDLPNLRARFDENTRHFSNRLAVHVGKSEDILPYLTPGYDFIYVDGSHAAIDVLTDAIWSFRLLKVGGVLAFDDYTWRQDLPILDRPKGAIDHFLENRKGEYELLHKKSAVIIKKTKQYGEN